MTTKQIEVSKAQRDVFEEQTEDSGHASVQEYLRSVSEEAKRKGWWDKVESLVLAGLDSGPPVEVTKEFWDSLRQKVQKKDQEAKCR